eukprot:CAMPEP_0180024676 /NCGR_PEP_ID=MMETSP0984-20121128/24218_1 /TAXON_ID=483367 /ORGANISM="non described non described, Strain CCMP 2436" /LENGTH=72 /DNA_ID=CAMNT_0021949195 /DNA_START=169 /DNA_END=383 /DNA_ORIENTATION=+
MFSRRSKRAADSDSEEALLWLLLLLLGLLEALLRLLESLLRHHLPGHAVPALLLGHPAHLLPEPTLMHAHPA